MTIVGFYSTAAFISLCSDRSSEEISRQICRKDKRATMSPDALSTIWAYLRRPYRKNLRTYMRSRERNGGERIRRNQGQVFVLRCLLPMLFVDSGSSNNNIEKPRNEDGGFPRKNFSELFRSKNKQGNYVPIKTSEFITYHL